VVVGEILAPDRQLAVGSRSRTASSVAATSLDSGFSSLMSTAGRYALLTLRLRTH
jgi:hypothetical protein